MLQLTWTPKEQTVGVEFTPAQIIMIVKKQSQHLKGNRRGLPVHDYGSRWGTVHPYPKMGL